MRFSQALEIVSKWVEVTTEGVAEVSAVEDKPYGWVFYYQAKNYNPNDLSTYLGGNAPVIFDRIDGEIRVTGTASETEQYLKEYEATLPDAWLLMSPEVSGFKNKYE
ncbi:hypothetical protein [Microbulbifer variabilis]|uniref:hypothetical protein n=1 Tax=Microbulbifer variabilis TaxID=266805 RepID=UPI000379348F|nr:hypothetical protein [Microbulbifer variabilis]